MGHLASCTPQHTASISVVVDSVGSTPPVPLRITTQHLPGVDSPPRPASTRWCANLAHPTRKTITLEVGSHTELQSRCHPHKPVNSYHLMAAALAFWGCCGWQSTSTSTPPQGLCLLFGRRTTARCSSTVIPLPPSQPPGVFKHGLGGRVPQLSKGIHSSDTVRLPMDLEDSTIAPMPSNGNFKPASEPLREIIHNVFQDKLQLLPTKFKHPAFKVDFRELQNHHQRCQCSVLIEWYHHHDRAQGGIEGL
ncbi:hypothetical protein BDN72DRAFT_865887 [Pluteus cervinus]|uniref:Uncharacterized protein n=1 Tax=Pluteus cervinus TaxID=181527 RepID=A0ACD2ZYG9_9AGAR|nr:hypothetical protein BDN72DRAFT_865887 [Pluteus cervinus]